MSITTPSATREPARRGWSLRPIRLSTFLLFTLVAGLLIAIYAQHMREARLRETISTYRNPQAEALIDALDVPIALSYDDGAHLDRVLKEFKIRTTTNPKMPGFPTGIPIFVDPIGLQDAEVSLNAAVTRPPSADALAIGEHLRRVLEPLGLAYEVKQGFLMITSKESLDVSVGDDSKAYRQYREVLR